MHNRLTQKQQRFNVPGMSGVKSDESWIASTPERDLETYRKALGDLKAFYHRFVHELRSIASGEYGAMLELWHGQSARTA